MTQRYRLYRRRNGTFYCQDNVTRQQESLGTSTKSNALRLLHARNEAQVQPSISMQMARVYAKASDPCITTRTWTTVMDEIVKTKQGPTLTRWKTAVKDKAYASILTLPLMETRAEHLLAVLVKGKVSTNVFLRRLHNFAIDLNWIAWPILVKKQWPVVRFKDKRGITVEEHTLITGREMNLERRRYYEMLWHTGASQSDMAELRAEDIDWTDRTISFDRLKIRHRNQTPPIIHFGDTVARLLQDLPDSGPLFPYLITVEAKHRVTEFRQRCLGLKITGVSLHSYRYGWAERAKRAGMSERFAQGMLGHNSKAVHRAYAKKAQVKIPSLEELEKKAAVEAEERQTETEQGAQRRSEATAPEPGKIVAVRFGAPKSPVIESTKAEPASSS